MNKFKPGVFGWIVVLIVILLGVSLWQKPKVEEATLKRQETLSSRQVALQCTTDMATQYHIHPELRIVINGIETPIPPNIGIIPGCMNSIHTHEGGGVIHVEAPVQKDFTVGDIFAVWKKDFSKQKIFDTEVTEATEIVMTVNGERVETYENTLLRDKDKIVISLQKK